MNSALSPNRSSVNTTNAFGISLNLSKYRLSKPAVKTGADHTSKSVTPAALKPKSIGKPGKSGLLQSSKPTTPASIRPKSINKLAQATPKTPQGTFRDQRKLSTIEALQSVLSATRVSRTKDSNKGATKLSFSTFLPADDISKAASPISSVDHDLISRKSVPVMEVTPKSNRSLKTSPNNMVIKSQTKVRHQRSRAPCASFLDLFDRVEKGEQTHFVKSVYDFQSDLNSTQFDAESKQVGNNGDFNVLTTSYITTTADDDSFVVSKIHKGQSILNDLEDSSDKSEIRRLKDALEGEKLGEKVLKNFGSETKARKSYTTQTSSNSSEALEENHERSEKPEAFEKFSAEAYHKLTNELREYKALNEADKKIIANTKGQIATLKNLCKNLKKSEENLIKKASQDDMEKKQKDIEMKAMEANLKAAQSEAKKLKNEIALLKEQNKKLAQAQEEIEKHKNAADHYKDIAEKKFKDCTSLAEEIICLRTDLDRLHGKYIKAQNASKMLAVSSSVQRLETQLEDSTLQKTDMTSKRRSSVECPAPQSGRVLKRRVTIVAPIQKHENLWDLCDDMDTPKPTAFQISPSAADCTDA